MGNNSRLVQDDVHQPELFSNNCKYEPVNQEIKKMHQGSKMIKIERKLLFGGRKNQKLKKYSKAEGNILQLTHHAYSMRLFMADHIFSLHYTLI